jgi:hypothetical protein
MKVLKTYKWADRKEDMKSKLRRIDEFEYVIDEEETKKIFDSLPSSISGCIQSAYKLIKRKDRFGEINDDNLSKALERYEFDYEDKSNECDRCGHAIGEDLFDVEYLVESEDSEYGDPIGIDIRRDLFCEKHIPKDDEFKDRISRFNDILRG